MGAALTIRRDLIEPDALEGLTRAEAAREPFRVEPQHGVAQRLALQPTACATAPSWAARRR